MAIVLNASELAQLETLCARAALQQNSTRSETQLFGLIQSDQASHLLDQGASASAIDIRLLAA